MKMRFLKRNLSCLFIASVIFTSCDSDSEDTTPNKDNKEVESSTCAIPKDLRAVVVTNDFFGKTVDIFWTGPNETAEYEIEYGPVGFTIGEGEKDEEEAGIKGEIDLTLKGGEIVDIYIRSKCGDKSFSEWVKFPEEIDVSKPLPSPKTADMTVTIDNNTYQLVQPLNFPLSFATIVFENIGDKDDITNLLVQGNRKLQGSNLDFEIKLYVNEDHWKPGTYDLIGEANPELNKVTDSYVKYDVFSDENSEFVEGKSSLTITKFDRENRRIAGTFSFNYKTTNKNDPTITSSGTVTNGSFEYSLDHPFFDK